MKTRSDYIGQYVHSFRSQALPALTIEGASDISQSSEYDALLYKYGQRNHSFRNEASQDASVVIQSLNCKTLLGKYTPRDYSIRKKSVATEDASTTATEDDSICSRSSDYNALLDKYASMSKSKSYGFAACAV
jgi:hypothetical protein